MPLAGTACWAAALSCHQPDYLRGQPPRCCARPPFPSEKDIPAMQINDPATLAEVNAVFDAYEAALVGNDIPQLDRLFWDSRHTLRYGAGENLCGIETIRAFRAARPGNNLAR